MGLALLLCASLASCEREDALLPSDASGIQRLETGEPEFTRESVIASAQATRAQLDRWRDGLDLDDALDREATVERLQDMINVYAARVDADYTEQDTRVLGYSVDAPGSFTGADAHLLYESIRTDLLGLMQALDGDAGLRFVAIGGVKSNPAGDSVFVVANAGSAPGGTGSAPLMNTRWADELGNINCNGDATVEITNRINRQLGQGVFATPTEPPTTTKFPFIRGVVSASVGALTPGYALNSVVTYDNRGFPDNTTVYTTSFPNCLPQPFVGSGQYRIHYDCSSDELCFTQQKLDDYVAEHNAIGELQAKNAARAAFPAGKLAKIRRVGHFVTGFKGGGTGPTAPVLRWHVATWYFGDFFNGPNQSTDQILMPELP